jgi:hypothetical protein
MQFRYRTPVLVGAWFSSLHMARADAIRAGQACRGEDGSFTWRTSAEIESTPGASPGQPDARRN